MPSLPTNTVEQVAPVSAPVMCGCSPGPRPGRVSVAAASPWTVAVPAGPSPGGDAGADGSGTAVAVVVVITTAATTAPTTVPILRAVILATRLLMVTIPSRSAPLVGQSHVGDPAACQNGTFMFTTAPTGARGDRKS